ncbi:MAG TPA: EF-hand domain-containing protein [Methylomirabilota bacterium]|nr:EF-hand domain-containing protein [Methylomirabilota bacterium]
MNNKIKALIVALGLTITTATLLAADEAPAPGERPEGKGPRPPMPAVIAALDANKDGVIDTAEIANASAALATLDKNADGSLSPEEFMGARPKHGGPRGEGVRDGGPRHKEGAAEGGPRPPRGPRGPRPGAPEAGN